MSSVRSIQEVAKLTPRGTLDQAHDEHEPPCHLCDKQIVDGESYVDVKFNDDRTRYAVCLPCANHKVTGAETAVLVKPKTFNSALPNNMLLGPGDPSLEVQTEAFNQIANQSLPQGSWRNVHNWLLDLCMAIESWN